MKTLKVISTVFLLVSTVTGQYNYQPPQDNNEGYQYRPPNQTPPPGSYLPPTTTAAPPPYESENQVDAEGQNPPTDDTEHAPGMPFDFSYAVKDDYGNDFAHQADSDGEVVKGEYRTLLPDGRMQIVKYTADWKNGYNAEVTYDGVERVTTRRPPTTIPNESVTLIDSQSIPRCVRDVYDPRCPEPEPTTTQPPFRCYPGINDPRCPTTQPPFRCYPGINDPRCPTTQPPPRCYPGSFDPRCPPPPPPPPTTQPPFRCYPGINDPRCPTTQPPPRCYPGSYDPRCPPPPPPPPTTQPPPSCEPGGYDPRCPPPPPPRCYPGSYDSRCPPETTYQPPTQRTTQPPTKPPGLYGAPSLPFGVRNNPKFGYSRK